MGSQKSIWKIISFFYWFFSGELIKNRQINSFLSAKNRFDLKDDQLAIFHIPAPQN
jgi:hypothetical protein